MRRTLTVFGVFVIALLVVSAVVFRYALDLTWVDTAYFVVTTFTTVGYGDISLYGASGAVKILGILLMTAGAASMAVVFALATDALLGLRLDAVLGRRSEPVRDHVILCGLGNVGVRIMEMLVRMGETVVVVEEDEESRYLPVARELGVPVVIGDVRLQATLEQAHVAEAACIIAATNQDLANLEAALNAQAVRPDIRIVLRVFDPLLATKIRRGFGIETTFSTASLAAPAFAMAALDPAVIGSFAVEDDVMLNVEIVVAEDARLAGMTTHELTGEGRYAILAHETTPDRRRLNPSEAIPLSPGDRIVVATPREDLPRLKELNRPVPAKTPSA